MQVLEKVAKAVSRNYGIQLVFKGTQAKTDGKTIVLPTLPENLDENDEAKVRGYCDHEISHLLETDMDAFKKLGRDGNRTLFDVLNLVEDLRCERAMGKRYPGAKVNMEKTMNLLHNESVAKRGMAKVCEHPLNKVWIEGRRQNCGYKIDAPDLTEDIKKVFGADFFERLRGLKSTADALELAQDMIEKASEPWNGRGDIGNDEGEGEGEGEGESKKKGDSDDGEGKSKGGSEDPKDGDADSGGDSDGDADSDGADDADGDDSGDGDDGDADESADGKGSKGGESADNDGDIEGEGDGDGDGGEGDGDPSDDSLDDGNAGETPSGDPIEGDDEIDTSESEGGVDLDGFKDVIEDLKSELEGKHADALSDGEYMVWDTSIDKIEKFKEASKNYHENPIALQLRGMNMLFEGLKEKGSLIIVPSSALESMNLGAIGGLTALAESQSNK